VQYHEHDRHLQCGGSTNQQCLRTGHWRTLCQNHAGFAPVPVLVTQGRLVSPSKSPASELGCRGSSFWWMWPRKRASGEFSVLRSSESLTLLRFSWVIRLRSLNILPPEPIS